MKLTPMRLCQLGRVITGKTPPTNRQEFFGGEYLFVTPTDLEYNHYYCRKTERTVTHEARSALPNQFVSAGAVMFTCIGATIGKCAIASTECLTNQQINSIVANEHTDSKFLYYLLCSNIDVVKGLGGGAATPIVSKSKFEELEFFVPCLRDQQAISAILSTYDDLVENNRRRMALLEEAARQLYREWFVRLRFPGHEHAHTTNGIPNGWGHKKVGGVIAKIENKKRIPKDTYLPEGPIPCVDQSSDFVGGFTDDEEAVYTEPLPVIVFGDHTRALKFVNFSFARGADGTQLIYPNSELLSTEYLYFALREIDLANYFYARHFKFLKEKEVIVPKYSLVQEFTALAKPCFEQVHTLRLQNQKLRVARDLLLPRLMSGEIAL
jgi:type I restriction enzyme, S subunit